jgi:O-antigen ligase
MYNTNFVGSFAALLLPMAIFLFLYTEEKKYKILSFAFSVLMMMTWIGSNSRAGYLGFSFGLVFMLILYRKKLKKDIKKIGALIVALLVIVVLMNTVSDGRVLSQFSRLNPVNEGERLETIQV